MTAVDFSIVESEALYNYIDNDNWIRKLKENVSIYH